MKRPLIFHPFLFAIFPVLALYAYRSRAIPSTLYDIALPLGLSLASSAIMFFLLKTITQHARKAGLLTSLALMWFFSYGHLVARLKLRRFLGDYFIFVGSLILLSVFFALVIKSKRSYSRLTYSLNIMSLLLVAFNMVTASRVFIQSARVSPAPTIETGRRPVHRPNIYFILLDAYARSDVLSEIYGCDNSDFIRHLEQKGFYVAAQSPANYGQTEFAVAAALNLAYLDKVAGAMGRGSTNIRPILQMIKNSEVRHLLKNIGYSFISLSSGLPATEIRNADQYIGFKGSIKNFRKDLLDTTPLPLFLNILSDKSQYDLHRARVLGAFRGLASLRVEESPYFVFAHILSPHTPYVFGKNGEAVNPPGRFTVNDGLISDELARTTYIKGYADQLRFINKIIIETVEGILANSEEPPVIILQSDHGPRAYFSWKDADATYLKESMSVLNAVYFPGEEYHDFYPEISPVNTFIALINRITGSNLGLLEDRSFYAPGGRPYAFSPYDPHTYTKKLSDFAKD